MEELETAFQRNLLWVIRVEFGTWGGALIESARLNFRYSSRGLAVQRVFDKCVNFLNMAVKV